jgi:hypothetical protein
LDESGAVIETHEHAGDFKEPWRSRFVDFEQNKAATR